MGSPITWFEIAVPSPEQAAKFYAELFGWHTESPGGGYFLVDTHSGRGMNGGITEPGVRAGTRSLFYAQGPDIQALLDKAGSLGGSDRGAGHRDPRHGHVCLLLRPVGQPGGSAAGS